MPGAAAAAPARVAAGAPDLSCDWERLPSFTVLAPWDLVWGEKIAVIDRRTFDECFYRLLLLPMEDKGDVCVAFRNGES